MQIDRHISISAGWVAGPAFGVAMMAAPVYFNLGHAISGICFWGAIVVFIATIVVVIVLSRGEKRAANSKLLPFGPITTGVMISFCIAVWHFWPDAYFENNSYPGFASVTIGRIYDAPDIRRKNVFDIGQKDGSARAKFYLSASDKFTFSIIDVNGETYPLEVRLGNSGISTDKEIMILCEAGFDGNSTFLRVSVNGEIKASRTIDFPINMGTRKWGPHSTLYSDSDGRNSGTMEVKEMIFFEKTLTRSMRGNFFEFEKKRFNLN